MNLRSGDLRKEVLHVVVKLRPGGGPAGYLYNLCEYLSHGDKKTSLLSICPFKSMPSDGGLFAKIARSIDGLTGVFKRNRKFDREMGRWSGGNPGVDSKTLEHILGARVIVSHDMNFSVFFLASCERPAGQKFFTFNHSPVDSASETSLDWSMKLKNLPRPAEVLRHELADIELRVYEATDGVILPCREAVDGYFLWDPRLRGRFEKVLESRRVYDIPTGVPELVPADDWNFRKKILFGDKIVVGYFGRYHMVKGFDMFCELVSLGRGDPNFHFISAGKKYLEPPKDISNYTDLGKLDKTDELPTFMRMCDIVVLPNRCTFFDLVTIEAMSLGRAVLTSATGGNKFMARKSEGILICSPLTAARMYSMLKNRPLEFFEKAGRENKRVYHREFTVERFAERHIDLAEKLLAE
jgi:glycosyltransferase involved in cell wall biosynthesis